MPTAAAFFLVAVYIAEGPVPYVVPFADRASCEAVRAEVVRATDEALQKYRAVRLVSARCVTGQDASGGPPGRDQKAG